MESLKLLNRNDVSERLRIHPKNIGTVWQSLIAYGAFRMPIQYRNRTGLSAWRITEEDFNRFLNDLRAGKI